MHTKNNLLVDSNVDKMVLAALVGLDEVTFPHSKRVQELAITLGREMKLSATELNQLGLGALLHDIGKQFVPPEILKKETPLTKDEWKEIEMHPVYGWECVSSLDLDDAVKEIILGHHLWANGKGGYPQTLASPCLLSQITAVADVVDAMTSDRPYRPALSISTCLDYLEEYIDTKFNRDVVQMFKTILSKERAWGDECKIWRGCDTDRSNARKSKDTN